MSELFQIGADGCGGLLPVIRVIRRAVTIIQWLIPIGLIIFGTIDLGKAVISSEDKEVKAAQKRLIQRFIYAAAVFFVVTFVTVIMDLVASGDQDKDEADTDSWQNCWRAAKS